jgi:CDP-4-dehydro-6-deoxyglucose reductase
MAAAFESGAFLTTLVSKQALGAGILDLEFAMKQPTRLAFRAGQFVSLDVGRDLAGHGVRRSFSIASPVVPGDRLRFIVRIIPEGLASAYFTALPVGAEVPMTGPYGFFVLEATHPGDIVFGATGTGVAAVLPMLDALAADGPEPAATGDDRSAAAPASGPAPARAPVRRVLYWGARHAEDLVARAEVEARAARARTEVHLCLTAPPTGWTGERGRITQAILAAFPGWKAPTFYLVGNGAMIAELKRELVNRGVDRKKQIRTEAFFD